jgi:hypothetical protein
MPYPKASIKGRDGTSGSRSDNARFGSRAREEGLAMIVMLASSMDFAAAIHEVAVAATPIDAQAHPNNTKRLSTKASRLGNQNVSRATFWSELALSTQELIQPAVRRVGSRGKLVLLAVEWCGRRGGCI